MKNCRKCGKPFVARTSAVYCSEQCCIEYHREKQNTERRKLIAQRKAAPPLTCQHCKKSFQSVYFTGTRTKFCSADCKTEFHKAIKRNRNQERLAKSKKACQGCGEPFIHRRRIDERFCTNKCKENFHAEQAAIARTERRNATTRTCPICEKEFTPKLTLREIYCSPNCRRTIGRKIYKMMSSVYKLCGTDKEHRSHEALDYSAADLLAHLQTFPQWDRLKTGTWHLDHIFPIIAFVRKKIYDPKLICCLENLQPLAGPQNCSKNDSYDQKAFDKWLKKMQK